MEEGRLHDVSCAAETSTKNSAFPGSHDPESVGENEIERVPGTETAGDNSETGFDE